jgi:Raf kinase inhibitor-like YbhB/YbcL family protein
MITHEQPSSFPRKRESIKIEVLDSRLRGNDGNWFNRPSRSVVFALAALVLSFAAPALAAQPLRLSSSAYHDGGTIPARFTCTGKGVSPPLAWSGAPQGTKSFALIVSDPDAPDPAHPKMTWIHWVLYDIPVGTEKLAAGATKHPPKGSRNGKNSWQRTGYGAFCPPIGRHRYVHTLYALDAMLPNLQHPNRAALKAAMHGHILARATLTATYKKPH